MSFSARQIAVLSELHKDLGKALLVAAYAVPTFNVGNPNLAVAAHLAGALLSIGISLYYKQMEEQIP